MPICFQSVRIFLATLVAAVAIFACVGLDNQAAGQATPRPEGNLNQGNMRQRQMTPEEMRAYEQAAWKANQADPQANRIQTPKLPPGFPLPQDERQYVEDLLDYWQKTSDQVKQYKCDFTRYEYDTGSVNVRDPKTNQLYAHQQAAGTIRFSSPDKARFETTKMVQFASPPKTPGGTAEFKPVEGHSIWGRSIHECWVCTGQAVYDFDFTQKRSYETKIPRQLQGNVVESPLPFLFGAKKADVMKRYWVRYIPKYRNQPNGSRTLIEDEYWLDVYPKRIEDARMYSKIELILNAKDFMPRAIHMYSPNYNPKKNNYSSRYFLFENRKLNGRWDSFKETMGYFIKPTLPFGWKTVERQTGQPQSAAAPGSGTIK